MPDTRVLGGRYEISDLLGYGGMAEVHRGRDARLGREVAVKTLRVDLARDPSFQARFAREAQSAASLNHPTIVAVYDTGEEDATGVSVPYIVMEYVDGETLREVLTGARRLPPERALRLVAEVLKALDYSHRNGIVHRDIKPGNVMLTRDGDVKVMDFGIARAVTSSQATMTQTASVIGTAQYLSPEQARGEHVDARSDIYSTGCLLYELLTGTPPFTGDSPVAVAYQHVRENPVRPGQLNPDLPPDVDAVVLKALAKNPANRYQTAAEMRADVERALAGVPVLATPVLAGPAPSEPAPEPRETTVRLREAAPPPPARRRRGLAYLLLLLAVLAVFGATAFLVKGLFGTAGTFAMPSVVNTQDTAADKLLTDRGLQVSLQRTPNAAPAGTVFDQDPQAGTQVSDGDTVRLAVSAGPARVNVPKLVGQPLADAKAALRANGLAVGRVTPRQSPKPAGEVLSTDPAANVSVPSGSRVDLVVASGRAPVPRVVGRSERSATATLQAAGFSVNRQTRRTNSAAPGIVVDQDPNSGDLARLGGTITITVARAPLPVTPSATPSGAPSPAPTTASASPPPSESPSPEPSSDTPTTGPTKSRSPRPDPSGSRSGGG